MPYRTDTIALVSPFVKRSVKLLPCQKEMMHWWYKQGMSIRAITRMFHCSRRSVQFILFPERKAKDLQNRADRGGTKIYYKKEKHREYMKSHRKHKHKVLKTVQP